MRCKKIQEFLRSDYIDGEASQSESRYIKEHLAGCLECRKLEKELKAQRALFENLKQDPVPEGVWQNIRDSVVRQRLNQEEEPGVLERLRRSCFRLPPVYVLTGAFTLVLVVALIAGIFIQKRQEFNMAKEEESIAGYGLNGENQDMLYSLETNVEEYFL